MSRNLSTTIESWQKFNIETVKRELDDKVIEIAKSLEEGDESRKHLIEQTKEFFKKINDEQRKLVDPILKSFKIEVDSSRKRNKLMEQVLLNLYKQLIDLPDPVQALENLQRFQKKAERVQDLEIENKQLRETLDEYNAEFAEVKNQEVTIKLLKDKIKELEDKSDQTVQQRLKDKEKELQKYYVEKEEAFQSTQLDLVKKLGDIEARCQSLQTQLHKAHTDMYDLKSKQDDLLNAKSLEIDLLLQDIDKLNERVANAERLNEQYVQQLAKRENKVNEESIENQQANLDLLNSNFQNSALEIELAAKEKEISQLVDDIQKLQLKSNKTRDFYENQRSQLEEKLVSHERALEQLEYELKKKQDYDEIKKELNILKSIEFNNDMLMTNNETNEDLIDLSNDQKKQTEKSIEILLLEKNRYLQNENTQFKNKLNELQIKNEKISKENISLINSNLEQKTLIIELEKDLLKLASNKKQVDSVSISLDKATISNDSTAIQFNKLDDNNYINESQDDSQSAETNIDSSLFNIVSSQRERFRQRVQELEAENLSNKQQVLFLTNEIDRLRSDNVKLYEKIKFLQSNSKIINLNDEDDSMQILNRYTNEYEKRLDPFSKFNYIEKQKRYSQLKLHDKFTLNFGRFILSSKLARLIFFGYFLTIHLLIFGSLYILAHRDASHRDISAECAHAYRDHMVKVHGHTSFEPPHN